MRKPRQRGVPSEYITCEVVLDHPRSDLWELVSDPELYPRFFPGLGGCTKTASGPREPARYTVRAAFGGDVCDYELRTVTRRTREKLVLATVPETGAWLSLSLSDARPGRTNVAVVISRPDRAQPAGIRVRAVEVQGWLREGLHRIGDYLAHVPDRPISHGATTPGRHGRIATTLVRSGVVRPSHPFLGVRQLSRLSRWGFNLVGGYAQAAARNPDRTAIADDRSEITFAQLHKRTELLAAGLAERGVQAGTWVAVLARNHIAHVECMVATGMLGAHAVLLNTGLAARQVDKLSQEHAVHTLLVDDEFEQLVQYLPADVTRISTTPWSAPSGRTTIEDLISGASPAGITPPDPPGKQIVLTSGTSGTPKGAQRPAPKGWITLAAILSRLPLTTSDSIFIAAPVFHSWGLAALQISTPVRATVVMQDRFDAEACLRAIAERRCTVLFAVPIMLQRIVNLPAGVRAKYDTSSLRIVASSGSTLPASLVTRFTDIFGDVLYNFYGSTEVSQATVAGPDDLRAAPTTAGYPALGTTVALLDPDGIPVPRGAVGRIFVGNEMLFDGYTDGGTVEVNDALMDTGDLGYLDAEGRLFVSGRDDEMIISGGENVFPRPVEEAIAALPQVEDVAVVGVPDDEYGHRLAAFIVPRAGARLDPTMIRSYVHHRLTRFSVPRDVTFLTRLPRNTTGKVLKRLLAERVE